LSWILLLLLLLLLNHTVQTQLDILCQRSVVQYWYSHQFSDSERSNTCRSLAATSHAWTLNPKVQTNAGLSVRNHGVYT